MNTLDPQTVAPRSLKILVVDDAPTNRQILEVFLGRLGHSIVTANDGEQAVAAFEAEQPDLILMDVMMPRMDGYEAAAKIKSMSKARWVPLVFLSALTTDEQMVTGLESGGDDYLTKPINFVMLKAKIRSLARTLDMQRKLDAARKQMASISENINDAVVTADVAGIIRWASQSALAVFGYTLDELVGQDVSLLMPPAEAEEHAFHMARYSSGGTPQVVGVGPREMVGKRKSGELFPMEIALTEMKVEGERSYVAVMRDITQRKHTEQRLRTDAQRLSLYFNEQERERDLAQDVVHKVMQHPGLTEPGLRFWVQPANHFSGDVVAASRRGDGQLFVMLADATGHGLAAAMSALPLLTLFYGAMYGSRSLSFVVFHMNRMMRSLLPVGRFVAATVIAIDEEAGTADIWQAGMPEVALIGSQGELRQRILASQVPLGVMDFSEEEAIAQMVTVPWQTGDEFMLVSDGVVEVKDEAGAEFGTDRLIAAARSGGVESRFDVVRDAVLTHCEGAAQHDDISLVLIRPQRRP